ncbi:CLUMA_CG018424, isoform A [Clunio marinus]|uniref:CLUMA_CG018424, isoform A n=1 Tax=Clunio marinus TaxID=568069 RepID=A0A1J1J0W6_9DIPT|nr:CLUMA_CG018424, isoform A [Clunio marinus]
MALASKTLWLCGGLMVLCTFVIQIQTVKRIKCGMGGSLMISTKAQLYLPVRCRHPSTEWVTFGKNIASLS